jgi:isomerase DpgB
VAQIDNPVEFPCINAFGGVTVQLPVNAGMPLSSELVTVATEACDRVDDAKHTSVLVIRIDGAMEGPADVWPGDADVRLVSKWEQVLRRIERLEAVIVAHARRRCSMAALELLLVSDYRVAMADFQIQSEASCVWPSMWIYRIVNQIGVRKSRNLVLFGRNLSARDVLDLGLIDEISANAVLNVNSLVASLTSTEVVDVGIRRRLMLEDLSLSYENAIGDHLAACARALRRKKLGQ